MRGKLQNKNIKNEEETNIILNISLIIIVITIIVSIIIIEHKKFNFIFSFL